jgi:hypothetical protein
MHSGDWLLGQLLLIGVTAALGASIARLPAFEETQLIEARLGAATAIELLGAGGAIGFLWLFGRGLVLRFLVKGGSLAMTYAVVLRLLGPALDEAQTSACAWGFLLGACACAIWLSMAVFSHAEALRGILHGYRRAAQTGDQGGSA